jgi:hypothetical protein
VDGTRGLSLLVIVILVVFLALDVASSAETAPGQSFVDVPPENPYFDYIEYLYQEGYTAGCSQDPLMYCPEDELTRAQSSVFILRGSRGVDFIPVQPIQQFFGDVGLNAWYADWVTALFEEGFTEGCGSNPLIYCPENAHTRSEGTVFLLRMVRGKDYEPPPARGYFADVEPGKWYEKWVDAAYDVGLLEPCATTPQLHYCPEEPLTRQAAAFMLYRAKTCEDNDGDGYGLGGVCSGQDCNDVDPNCWEGSCCNGSGGENDPTAVITLNHDLSEGNGTRGDPYIIHSDTVQFRLNDSYDVDGMDQLINGGTFYTNIHSGRFLGCGIEWHDETRSWEEIKDREFSAKLSEIGFYNLRLTVTDNTGRENEVKVYIYTNVSPVGLGPEPLGNHAPQPVVTFYNAESGSGSYTDPYVIDGSVARFTFVNSTDSDGQLDVREGTFHYELFFSDGTHPEYVTGYTYEDMQNGGFTFDMDSVPGSERFRLVAYVVDRWGRYGETTVRFIR